jgi:hypothetical protein
MVAPEVAEAALAHTEANKVEECTGAAITSKSDAR